MRLANNERVVETKSLLHFVSYCWALLLFATYSFVFIIMDIYIPGQNIEEIKKSATKDPQKKKEESCKKKYI